MPLVRVVLAAVLAASSLSAQTLSIGEPFPLTNTRYIAVGGTPQLVSNGHDLFLLWRTFDDVRFTRVVAGEHRIGRVLMDRWVSDMDVVWTGSHFFVVGVDATEQTIYGIVLDGLTGAPVAPAVPLVRGDSASLARDANTILLRYTDRGIDHARRLTQTGQLVSEAEWFTSRGPHGDLFGRSSGFLEVATHGGSMFTVTTLDSNGALQAQFTIPKREGGFLQRGPRAARPTR